MVPQYSKPLEVLQLTCGRNPHSIFAGLFVELDKHCYPPSAGDIDGLALDQLGGSLGDRLRDGSYLCPLRLHKAPIVRNNKHVMTVDGDADRVLKSSVEKVQHDVRLSVRLDDLKWLSAQRLWRGSPTALNGGVSMMLLRLPCQRT